MSGGSAASTSTNVVVVDDDPLILRVVEHVLLRRNLTMVATERAIGVMNLIARSRPRVVLLDVKMPALDGPSLVKLIREDPDIHHTVILLHSALPASVLQQQVEECGADGYVAKSLGVASLEKALDRWCPPGVP